MQIPGVHIETLHNPVRYTYAQIETACAIAQLLRRGKFVLVEAPRP
jgi:Rad3-related DNA helicase